jgi:hypothetical protein
MLDLVTQSITGTREETFDIELGDPPDVLFEPPPGVAIRVVTEPRGLRYLEGTNAPAQPIPGMHKP